MKNEEEEIKKVLNKMFDEIDLKALWEEWAFNELLRSYGWYRFPEKLPTQAIELYDSGSKQV